MRVTEPPTFNAIADALTERLVTAGVDEVVAVGEVGDGLLPQVAVTTVAMTVTTKRARREFTIRPAPPRATMLTKAAILPLAGTGFNARAAIERTRADRGAPAAGCGRIDRLPAEGSVFVSVSGACFGIRAAFATRRPWVRVPCGPPPIFIDPIPFSLRQRAIRSMSFGVTGLTIFRTLLAH